MVTSERYRRNINQSMIVTTPGLVHHNRLWNPHCRFSNAMPLNMRHTQNHINNKLTQIIMMNTHQTLRKRESFHSCRVMYPLIHTKDFLFL